MATEKIYSLNGKGIEEKMGPYEKGSFVFILKEKQEDGSYKEKGVINKVIGYPYGLEIHEYDFKGTNMTTYKLRMRFPDGTDNLIDLKGSNAAKDIMNSLITIPAIKFTDLVEISIYEKNGFCNAGIQMNGNRLSWKYNKKDEGFPQNLHIDITNMKSIIQEPEGVSSKKPEPGLYIIPTSSVPETNNGYNSVEKPTEKKRFKEEAIDLEDLPF